MSNQQEEIRILPDHSFDLARREIVRRGKIFINKSLDAQFGPNFLNPPTPAITQLEQMSQPVITPVSRVMEADSILPMSDEVAHLDESEIRARINEVFDEAA